MKKLFSSVVSLLSSAALLICSGSIECTADTFNLVNGTYDDFSETYVLEDAEDLQLTLDSAPEVLSNFDDGSYNYRDFLDENNMAVYDALLGWTTPSEDAVTVKLPSPVSVSVSGLPGTESYTEEDAEAFKTAVFSNCKAGIDCLSFDYPEIFWLDMSKLAIGTGNVTYSRNILSKKYVLKVNELKFTPAIFSSYENIDDAFLYKEKLESAIDNFKVEGETRYEQLKCIHDTIALFTYYDENALYSSSAVGALVESGSVCEGYSKGFKLICDRLNIPCVLIFGNYDADDNVAHMWNYVKMEDGNWYAVDVTWDDTDGQNGHELKNDYFLKGSEKFFINHMEEPNLQGTIFTYPEISSEDYSPAVTDVTVTSTTTSSTTTTNTTTTTTTATTATTTATNATTSTSSTTTSTTLSSVSSSSEAVESTDKSTSDSTSTSTSSEVSTTTSTSSSYGDTATTIASETETTTETASETLPIHGDYNNDGKVNVADIVICAGNLIGRLNNCICDFNEDGEFDVFDLLAMRKYVVNKL